MVEGREAARHALATGRPALLWRRQLADTETPVAAALKLIEPGRGDFLLESVEGGSVRGRHSLIGLAPDLVFRAVGETAEINAHWLTDRGAFAPCSAPSLPALRALVESCRMDVPAELPRALACLDRYERRFARAIASIINVVDPDVIVLGGGLSNMRRLYERVPALWGSRVFSDRVDTRLTRAKHGDASGVRGAAWLWPAR